MNDEDIIGEINADKTGVWPVAIATTPEEERTLLRHKVNETSILDLVMHFRKYRRLSTDDAKHAHKLRRELYERFYPTFDSVVGVAAGAGCVVSCFALHVEWLREMVAECPAFARVYDRITTIAARIATDREPLHTFWNLVVFYDTEPRERVFRTIREDLGDAAEADALYFEFSVPLCQQRSRATGSSLVYKEGVREIQTAWPVIYSKDVPRARDANRSYQPRLELRVSLTSLENDLVPLDTTIREQIKMCELMQALASDCVGVDGDFKDAFDCEAHKR